MTEIWKDIEGYDGKYQVSNLGRIRSVDHYIYVDKRNGTTYRKKVAGRILKTSKVASGYLATSLGVNNSIRVHRVVAKAFVPGFFEGADVNHKDENKQNNKQDNLEWVTHKDNCNYGFRNKIVSEKAIKHRGVPIMQLTKEHEFVQSFPSIVSASNTLGIDKRWIQSILDTNRTAHGYIFIRKK